MNTELLKSGQTVKNYKELCSILGENIKEGDSKVSQLREWERFFKFSKKGHKYFIEEIYPEELPKMYGKELGNNSIYQKHLELILLDYLARECEDYPLKVVELTTRDLILITGLCNETYIKKEINDLISSGEVKQFDVNDFYRRTSLKFNRIIESILTNLKNRCIIVCDTEFIIHYKGRQKQASIQEKALIAAVKKNILKDMGLNKIQDVFNKFKQKEFYDEVNAVLFQKYGWEQCYQIHKIAFTKNSIQQSIESYEKEFDLIHSERLELNQKVIDSVNQQALQKYEKNQNQLLSVIQEEESKQWGTIDKMDLIKQLKIFVLHQDYVKNQETLAEYFLRI